MEETMALPELQDYEQRYDDDRGEMSPMAQGEWREELKNVERRARDFANQRPLVALGAALAFGYLLGRFASRG
jgi:hypothetical protein